MQIKKSLADSAKRVTPYIEASNTGVELGRLAARIEELLTYVEAKELRDKERRETGMSFSERTDDARRRREEEAAASRENAKPMQVAREDAVKSANRKGKKSKTDVPTGDVDDADPIDPSEDPTPAEQ